MSRERGVNAAIQLFIVECCCVHCTIVNKLKVINYPFEIVPDTHNDFLSETILFGDLYRRLNGFDRHILPVDVTMKLLQFNAAGVVFDPQNIREELPSLQRLFTSPILKSWRTIVGVDGPSSSWRRASSMFMVDRGNLT